MTIGLQSVLVELAEIRVDLESQRAKSKVWNPPQGEDIVEICRNVEKLIGIISTMAVVVEGISGRLEREEFEYDDDHPHAGNQAP